MDEEFEDFQEALTEYNLEHGIVEESGHGDVDANMSMGGGATASSANRAGIFRGGAIAIDLGTLNIRTVHRSTYNPDDKPTVVVNREGGRATPNHIQFENDGTFLTGKLAAAKFFERSNSNNPVMNS